MLIRQHANLNAMFVHGVRSGLPLTGIVKEKIDAVDKKDIKTLIGTHATDG